MPTTKQIVDAAMKPLDIDIEWEERKEMTNTELDEAIANGKMSHELAWEAARELSQLRKGEHPDFVMVPREVIKNLNEKRHADNAASRFVPNFTDVAIDEVITAAQKGETK